MRRSGFANSGKENVPVKGAGGGC